MLLSLSLYPSFFLSLALNDTCRRGRPTTCRCLHIPPTFLPILRTCARLRTCALLPTSPTSPTSYSHSYSSTTSCSSGSSTCSCSWGNTSCSHTCNSTTSWLSSSLRRSGSYQGWGVSFCQFSLQGRCGADPRLTSGSRRCYGSTIQRARGGAQRRVRASKAS